MEDGVIESTADGNIELIMGLGYPAHTGGVFQHINSYGVSEYAKERSTYSNITVIRSRYRRW